MAGRPRYHFGSKEGLFLEAERSNSAEYEAALRLSVAAAAPVAERIHRACRTDASFRREQSRILGVVGTLVSEGIATGASDACDPATAALVLVGAAEAAAAVPKEQRRGLEGDVLDRTLSVVFKGLAPPGAARTSLTAMTNRPGEVVVTCRIDV